MLSPLTHTFSLFLEKNKIFKIGGHYDLHKFPNGMLLPNCVRFRLNPFSRYVTLHLHTEHSVFEVT